jgi:hypothetical protein
MGKSPDPSPEEIRLACLQIQSEWTEAEKLKRLRCDLRPSFTLCDGRQQGIDAEDYRSHHDERAAILQAMADP